MIDDDIKDNYDDDIKDSYDDGIKDNYEDFHADAADVKTLVSVVVGPTGVVV